MSMDQTHFIIVSSPQPTSFNLNSQVLTSVTPVSHTSQIITTQNRISLPIINENVSICEAPQIFTIPSMECGTQLSLVSNEVVVPVQQIPTGQTIILRSPIQTTIPIKQIPTNRIIFTPEQLGMSKENYYANNVNGNISTNENSNSNARTVLTFVTPDGEEKDVAFNGTPETINIPYVLYEFCKSSGFEDTMEGHMDCEPEEVQKQRKEQAQEVYKKLEQEVIAESNTDKKNQKNGTPAKVYKCSYCGGEMKERKCLVCKRSVPRFTTKVDLNKISEAQNVKFVFLQSTPKVVEFKKRRCARKKKNDAPVCLTISSDEEEEEGAEKENGTSISNEEIELSLSRKEPIITEFTEAPHRERIEGGGVDITELLDSNITENALLQCRTVRIGSYKVVPKNKVTVNEYGLKFDVPDLNGERTTIKLLRTEIVKVLANFNKATPCLFYYLTNSAGVKIRNALKMPHKPDTLYFDPTSTVEKYRRVTFLPENISEDKRLFIKSIYDKQSLLDELSDKEVNDILVKTSPQENIQTPNTPMTRSKTATPRGSQTSITGTAGIQTIMVYPPPPMKNGISINTEDYGCLGEDQYLNDIIIDFYLKWFFLTNLSPEDQKRTHIFSSFFYKRLTQKAPAKGGNKYQDDPKLSPAERRHARVKGWTKSVDLFSKDFIIIPINEHSHWFLGIICFPGLTGPVRFSDNAPVKIMPKKGTEAAPKFVGSTSITVVKPEPTIVVETDEDEEEKDEAEADEDEIEPNSSEDEEKNSEELLDDATPRMPRRSKIDAEEPIKQPCILIFDSLAGASRARVCATLREYLQVEYSLKHKGQERDFSKNTFKGAVPKVPQQTNYTDCGLYVLQFVEAFFNKPITNYKMPIKGIRDWFPAADIESQKRFEIQQLLHSLMEEQNVDVSRLNLPELNLHHGGHLGLVDYSDGEELDDLPVEEEEEEEIAEEEMMEVEEEFHEAEEDVEPQVVTKVYTRPKPDFPSINKISKQPNLSNLNQISISRSSNSLPPLPKPKIIPVTLKEIRKPRQTPPSKKMRAE